MSSQYFQENERIRKRIEERAHELYLNRMARTGRSVSSDEERNYDWTTAENEIISSFPRPDRSRSQLSPFLSSLHHEESHNYTGASPSISPSATFLTVIKSPVMLDQMMKDSRRNAFDCSTAAPFGADNTFY